MRAVRLVILGSTGSIGCSTLEIIRSFPQRFEIVGLVAGANEELLLKQVEEFRPRYAVLMQKEFQTPSLPRSTMFISGASAAEELAGVVDANTVVAGLVGVAGLRPTLRALTEGKKVLLANKETLVCAGEFMYRAVRENGGSIIPVDSEHSAIAQLLIGDNKRDLFDITLTASGGPFLKTPIEQLNDVTPEQAVKHPRWSMGAKVSVDSATMVNKALEVAEARWLFDLPPQKINVLVHPQSIVHSLITLNDGTQLAQLSHPDMKGPIAYALTGEVGRLEHVMKPLNLGQVGSLEFSELDNERFPAVELMKEALQVGGAFPTVFNCINEIAVEQFMQRKIRFIDIVTTIKKALDEYKTSSFSSVDDVLAIHEELREKYTL